MLVIESDKRYPANAALEVKNLLWGAQFPESAVLFCRGVMFFMGALLKVVRGQKAKEMVVHMCFQSIFNIRSFQIYLILLSSVTMFDFPFSFSLHQPNSKHRCTLVTPCCPSVVLAVLLRRKGKEPAVRTAESGSACTTQRSTLSFSFRKQLKNTSIREYPRSFIHEENKAQFCRFL